LSGIIYGFIEGPPTHWSELSLGVLLAGLCSFIVFLIYEYRHKDPMLQLQLFSSPNFVGANAATFAMYGGLGGFFFALVIYVQTTMHYTSLQAGLVGLPVSICLALLSGRVGALAGKYGPRLFMTVGPILAGVGILLLLPLHEGSIYITSMLPGIVLFGLGLALTVAPLTMTVLASVEEADSGIASAVNNAVSRVSGLIVIALLGIFGAEHAYQFAVILCGSLAIAAGILSLFLVTNSDHKTK
jgi:predicted MFS family arabinose efflux permease